MDTNTERKLSEKVIFFDGVCNLCNHSVNTIIDFDPKGKFQFASLQSEFAKKTLDVHFTNSLQPDSIVLLKKGKVYTKSSAALQIARDMSGLWKLMFVFWLVPAPLRNAVYDFVAKYRYKWFGKQDACRVPTPEIRSRFIDY